MSLGAQGVGFGSQWSNGDFSMDDIAVYTSALSSAALASHYTAGNTAGGGGGTPVTTTTTKTTTYSYDQALRLTKVTPSTGASDAVSYTYDGDGLRSSRTKNDTTKQWTWDSSGGLPLILTDGARSYIYGPDGQVLEQLGSSGTPMYLHHDQIGSTRLITDANGATTGSMHYKAYGKPAGASGSVNTPIGYAGQYTDPDTGLIYMRAREYDPATGQFLTRDPAMAMTQAPYAYALADPVLATDPTGLFSLDDAQLLANVVAAGAGVCVVAGMASVIAAPEALAVCGTVAEVATGTSLAISTVQWAQGKKSGKDLLIEATLAGAGKGLSKLSEARLATGGDRLVYGRTLREQGTLWQRYVNGPAWIIDGHVTRAGAIALQIASQIPDYVGMTCGILERT